MSKINPELICLGSDWAPSGSKHIWDEAKFAQDFSVRYFYNASVPQNINDIFLDMISYIPAKTIGSERIGEIAVGKYADFYIVSKNRKIPKQNIRECIGDIFKTFSDFETVGTIINGNLIFGIKELFDMFELDNSRFVSIKEDMKDENGKEITADKGAENLCVYVPDVEIKMDNKTSVVHIDFNAAVKTLNDLFKDFNEKNQKNFVRGKLLSSYDIPYCEQIKKLRNRFGLNK